MKKQLLMLLVAASTAFYSSAQLNNVSVGQDAPDFTVTEIHGQSHTLSDYAGKYVVLTSLLIGVAHAKRFLLSLIRFIKNTVAMGMILLY